MIRKYKIRDEKEKHRTKYGKETVTPTSRRVEIKNVME